MNKITFLFSSLEGAYAPNTIRSYRSDYMHYSNWCQKYQYDPLNIHENKFADYILEMGGSLTVATIISLASYQKIKQRYIVLFLIVFSFSMEVFQLYVEGRSFEFLDLGANVVGILLALLFAKKIIRH